MFGVNNTTLPIAEEGDQVCGCREDEGTYRGHQGGISLLHHKGGEFGGVESDNPLY